MASPSAVEAQDAPLCGVLVLTSNAHAVGRLAARCSTFSCALGNPFVEEMTKLLKHRGSTGAASSNALLFACENDHDAIERLTTNLEGSAKVVPCLVDRICVERKIVATQDRATVAEQGKKGVEKNAQEEEANEVLALKSHPDKMFKISVLAEPFAGSIVLMNYRSAPCRTIPLAGPSVLDVKTKAEGEYFKERKLLLVNGTHTTLAFITLCASATTLPPASFPLLTWKTCTEAQRQVLWAFMVARCLVILWHHDAATIMRANGLPSKTAVVHSLLAYARESAERTETITDSTGRILGGGIVNRYRTRLYNVQELLTQGRGGFAGSLEQVLLREAHLTYEEMLESVSSLVAAASRFATPCTRLPIM
eukprot:GHVT01019578.1.p1 GENE.GHVT01019578.1~~GHVT01019578.1.p1  ORF type:complete len:403 (+),score=57.83 GHVT01019578.1:114-1211(+)